MYAVYIHMCFRAVFPVFPKPEVIKKVAISPNEVTALNTTDKSLQLSRHSACFSLLSMTPKHFSLIGPLNINAPTAD